MEPSNKSQQKQTKKPQDISFFLRGLSKIDNRIFYFFFKRIWMKRIYHAHETIAMRAGCSVSSVKRALDKFYEAGLLDRDFLYFQTNEYFIHPAMKTQEFYQEIEHYYRNFFKFFLLLTCSITALARSELLLNAKGFNLLRTSSSSYSSDPSLAKDAMTSYGARDVFLPAVTHSIFLPEQTYVGRWSLANYNIGKNETGDANRQVGFAEFEDMIRTRRVEMENDIFTSDQMQELAQYPMVILQQAIALLKVKNVEHKFAYVKKVCEQKMAALNEDKDAQPAFGSYKKTTSTGKPGYHGKTVSVSQDRQARDSMQQRYTNQVDNLREQKRAKLHDKGIDLNGLSDYQIKLALEGRPYLMDDMLKDIEAGPFRSVAVFQDLFGKKLDYLKEKDNPDLYEEVF